MQRCCPEAIRSRNETETLSARNLSMGSGPMAAELGVRGGSTGPRGQHEGQNPRPTEDHRVTEPTAELGAAGKHEAHTYLLLRGPRRRRWQRTRGAELRGGSVVDSVKRKEKKKRCK